MKRIILASANRSVFRQLLLGLTMLLTITNTFGQTSWDGSENSDWNNAGNWSAGVPGADDPVIIPAAPVSPVIGSGTAALAKSVFVQGGTLTIQTSASLTINGSAAYATPFSFTAGLNNLGTISNSGALILGSLSGVGAYGIVNQATFNNNNEGIIRIDDSSDTGLFNASGTFTNTAKIMIGSTKPVGNHGLWNDGTFQNNAGGDIRIDRCSLRGLVTNSSTFTTNGAIVIGGIDNVGTNGVENRASIAVGGCGSLLVLRGNFLNETSKTVTNGGFIRVNYNLSNKGAFTNSSILKYGTLTGNITNSNIVVNDSPAPILSYGPGSRGILGIFTDSLGIISAGTFSGLNTFTPLSSIPFGSSTLYIKLSVECTFVVPFNYQRVRGPGDPTTTMWTANVNSAWSNAGNWTEGVPDQYTDAIIPDKTTDPVIGTSTAAVSKSLLINTSAVLTIQAGSSLTINGNATFSTPFTLTTGLNNQGTVQNSGSIILGSVASVGTYGIVNQGAINNEAGSAITVNRFSDTGIYNASSGTFNNKNSIIIGSVNNVGVHGIFNESVFNNTGGNIQINRSSVAAIRNAGGTFTNTGDITIGAGAGVGTFGVRNDAVFLNNAGHLRIDQSTEAGIYHTSGTFTNEADIVIGGLNATSNVHGILSRGTFNNNAGQIQIDRATTNALNHGGGIFNNKAKITIGTASSVGLYGIKNSGTLSNTDDGQIKIDDCSDTGFYNATGGTFNNMAKLTIGSVRSVGIYGIFNEAAFNNNGGDMHIDHAPNAGIHNSKVGTFTNTAAITIGQIETGQYGVRNENIFLNNPGGDIRIYKTDVDAVYNMAAGAFTNTALITVGGGASINLSTNGIRNAGTFDNNEQAKITIDNISSDGIRVEGTYAAFHNKATIAIGGSENAVSSDVGIRLHEGTFYNDEGGDIRIDNLKSDGVYQAAETGIFSNSGSITLGASKVIGGCGILSQSEFSNELKGTIRIDRSGEEGIRHYGSTFTNSGKLIIGEKAIVQDYGIVSYFHLFKNMPGGEISIHKVKSGGLFLDQATTFENSGTLTIGSDSEQVSTLIGSGAGTFTNKTGGVVKGSGAIQSATARFVHNGGKISPGYSPGMMTFTGNRNFTNSLLDMEVNGTGAAGVNFDQIVVIGTATLGGTLNVAIDYNWTPGDKITILSAQAISGIFSSITGLPASWEIDYTANAVTLTAISPLPVTLVSFNVKTTGAVAQLQWRTTSETDNKGFYIERSADALRWSQLGFVDGQATSSAIHDYLFQDQKPLMGVNYYRLRQMDFDGKTQYSRVQGINFENPDNDLIVWADETKQVYIKTENFIELITVYDLSGRAVAASKRKNFNLSHLPGGLFLVRVHTSSGVTTRKILLQ